MHRFHVLGRLDLRDAQGNEVRSVLAQPKRLAIVAYLAVNEPNGACRRDKLLGIFWPELTQERARKALNKAVHFLRQELGADVLVSRNADDVALDGSALWCDATAFAEAANAEQLSEALDLYRGDLLPAFYIEGAPAFEEWLEQERARLRRLASRAAHRLADERERDGQFTTAVTLARRAVELSDEDERVVRQLLELLDRLGDRSGALYAYEKFARRLASEYDAEPAAETKTLIAHIRAREDARIDVAPMVAPRFEPYTNETLIGGRAPALTKPADSFASATEFSASPAEPVRTVAPKRPTFLRRSLLAACGVVVAAVIVTALYRRAPRIDADQNTIAVLPFRVTSSDSSYNYLREGVIDLANALLTGDGLPRAIDTRTALRAWSRAGGSPAHELTLDQSIDVGRHLGAAQVLLGELVVTPTGMSANARLVRVKDATVVSEQSSVAARNELQLVTKLLGRLLALNERDAAIRAASLSDSIAAVREYLAGLRVYRAGCCVNAGPAFERALGIDPTFAAAALWGSVAGYPELNTRAWQLRDRMSRRDRAILTSLPRIGPNNLKPYTAEELLAAADRAARLNPDRSEVWAQLGNYLFDFGASVGVQDWQRRAAWAIDSAVALDSSNATAIAGRNDLALVQADAATFNRTLSLLRRHVSDSMYFLLREWEIASVIGDSASLVRLHPRLPAIASWLREIASWNPRIMRAATVSGWSLADAEAAVRADLNHVRADPLARSNLFQTLFAIAALRGNVERAATWADSVTPTDSITPTVLFHVRVMTALLVDPGYDEAAVPSARYFRALADTASAPPEVADGNCFSELWRVRQGDTSDTRRAIARIRRAMQSADFPIGLGRPGVGPLDVCPLFLEAQLDRRKNPRAPSPALDSLERLMRRGVGNNLPGDIANLFIARWRSEQGDLRSALEAVRRRSRIRGFAWLPIYTLPIPAFWREEGRLAALVGDTTSAVRAYTKYLRIRDDPSPGPMAAEVRRVREHLAQLTRGGASAPVVR